MQVRAVIIAKGDVQRVGYRDAVERVARKLKITGFVENIKPYDVRIVCEGERTKVKSFINQIKIKESPIDVEEVMVNFEGATGEFDYFEIKRGDMAEELGERLDIAGAELKQNTSILKEFKKETNENLKLLDIDLMKHDIEAQKRIEIVNKEISEIKERLTRVESGSAS